MGAPEIVSLIVIGILIFGIVCISKGVRGATKKELRVTYVLGFVN